MKGPRQKRGLLSKFSGYPEGRPGTTGGV